MARFDVHFEFKGSPPKKPDVVEVLTPYTKNLKIYRQIGGNVTVLSSNNLDQMQTRLNVALKKRVNGKYERGIFLKATIEKVELEDVGDEET